jgi:hypothetical protein
MATRLTRMMFLRVVGTTTFRGSTSRFLLARSSAPRSFVRQIGKVVTASMR